MAQSNRQRRVFPDAFKLEAVGAVRGGRSVSTVAADQLRRSGGCGANSIASGWSVTS